MLKLISGSYKPTLEEALLSQVRTLKKNPMDPILIVTASSRLKDHLQKMMAEKMGAVLNLHFHTLGSLAQTIVHETSALDRPVLSDSLFYDFLVKNLIRKNKPFESFEDMAVPDGFPSAVRSTLRDLLDAGVDEDLVRSAMEEKFVGKDVDVGSLKELLTLYRLYLEKLESLPVVPNSKILAAASERAAQSQFLSSAKGILFYGFYDLTGRQVELFESIVKNHESCLYFPYLADDSDFEFAKRFRDNTLHRIGFTETVPAHSNGKSPAISVFNVSGRHDEAWLAAREVRRLMDEGLDPSDIAVVSRSRERLAGLSLRFEEWKIPTVSTVLNVLLEDPRALDILSALKTNFVSLGSSSWAEFGEKALAQIPQENTDHETSDLYAALTDAIKSFENFDLLGEKVSADDFLESFQSRLSQTPWPASKPMQGVSLLHTEAARGLSFKAMILIGMEERVFPRIVREDPFLRDSARFELWNTIGYKIGLKLTALEEERLLFRILTDAAPHLIFIYQRSDDEGRVVGASPYLRDFLHRLNWKDKWKVIKRSPLEKLKGEPLETVSPSDAVLSLLDQGQDKAASEFLDKIGGDGSAFTRGLRVQAELQKFFDPTALDGLIGPVNWAELFHNGLGSASAMETFGLCPWKFFGTKMLGLEEPQPIDPTQLPPRDRGTFVHGFLESLFKALTKNGTNASPQKIPSDLFDEIFNEKIPSSLGSAYGIPPALFEIIRIEMKETLRVYLSEELERLHRENRKPLLFEKNWEGSLPAPLNGGKWRGAIDRIDQGPDGVSVIDYKTGQVPKNSVALEAIRGKRSQPPLYLLIAEQLMKASSYMFSYHPVGREHESKDFSDKEWGAHRVEILKTIGEQLDLMKKGVFTILPDSYCDFCDLNRICRKHHSVSAFRAGQGAGSVPVAIRRKKLNPSSPKSVIGDPESLS